LAPNGLLVEARAVPGWALPASPQGMHLRELLPEPLVSALNGALAVGSDQVSCPVELLGEQRHVEAYLFPNGAGELVLILTDHTEWHRTLEALRRSETRTQAILNAVPDDMFRSDRDLTLLDYLPRHRTVVAAHRDQIVGLQPHQMGGIPGLSQSMIDMYVNAMREVFRSGQMQTLGYWTDDQAGSQLFIEARLVQCGDDEVLGMTRDITDLKRAEEELRKLADVKQKLAKDVLNAQEQERGRLARELHDAVGQRLLVHRLDAEWLAKRGVGPIQETSERLCRALDETLELVRQLATGLRPPSLDDLGLGSALHVLAGELARSASIECECFLDSDAERVTPEAAIALYRIAQEALVNAVRHGECSRVEIQLSRVAAEQGVQLRIEDDGNGMSTDRLDRKASLGLVGMRERAELLGGSVTVTRGAQGGTVVCAQLPASALLGADAATA
jgi:signal transduction histidine kinase